MNIKFKNRFKRILSSVMAAGMALSLIPSVSFAAQSNEYIDPADVWIEANGRTSEFDMNATVTYNTGYCPICDMPTSVTCYRVPEYTRTGETALNRSVYYSDGTLMDGSGKGNLDDGTPGVDAKYTGHHWTKSVCQNCGTINSVDGINAYSCGKDVYSLNPCDSNFFLDFDNTEYTPYNSKTHTTKLKKGKYCQFCKGTYEKATEKQENHNFTEMIDAELGNQRFHITADCDDCGYKKNEYAAAKSVVQSYYGKVDGKAHTVTVSDLSESGVHTSIRYGTEANKCNKTSAPNYTDEGYYPVYYEIDYTYGGENMTENGVSYVWLLSDTPPAATNSVHTHDFRYLETVRPTCTELGYDRFQCNECGALQKTNYTPSTGHDYNTVVIRDASCQQGGLELHACKSCGSYYTENTSMTDHKYQTNKIASTCTVNGYTEHICIDCGYKYITDLTPLAKHDYKENVTAPTCKTKGFTTYTCKHCDDTYVSDYTEPRGHKWDSGHIVTNSTCESEGVMKYDCKHCDEKMIKAISATGHTLGEAATCTAPQICTVCNAILELPTGHSYTETVTAPTCTAMGYTTYTCENCDNSYVGDYTDKIAHKYSASVTAPTCTAMGYTTFTCSDCGDSYVSDYTDKTAHKYIASVTAPTCTEMGYTTYTCADCGDSYVSDYTEVLPHNYNKQTIEPTCTEQGYTIYTCPDCGKEYIGDEQEPIEHEYKADVTAPTCTEMGYTTYTCADCGKSYVADYTDAKGHSYDATVTAPTCTELGYTTYTCADCGETHRSDYIEATGHKLSDWIIDTPATIEYAGEKHIECVTCGTVISIAAIPKLPDNDNSDEDGHSKVGDYNILITDKDSKPIFNSEISIDTNDNLTIKLPDGRLLSAEDITTITVTYTETQQPATDINIFIADSANNAATGKTDANGQLAVPNTNSSTGNTNGTVADNDKTYVVIATDKNGELIPNCNVVVGDNYSIDVKLPTDTAFNKDNRVTITVVTEKGEAVSGLRVQVIGDNDFIENGYTNIKGQITLPMSNTDITDNNGNADVGEIKDDKIYDYTVVVSDEQGFVENALITLVAEDNSVLVCLPDGKVIDYYNRTTVKVTKADGTPVEDWKVTVYNKDGSAIRTEVTDEDGIVIVPPLSEAPISKPTPTPDPDAEATPLPGIETTPTPDPSEQPSETEKPSETETPSGTETPVPSEKPTETEKPSEPTPTPDMGSGTVVQNKNYKYRVFVWDNDGAITEFGLVKLLENGNLEIELPTSKTLNPENRINVKVVNDNDETPVKGITVNVTDAADNSASDITNSEGIAVVPVSDTDITDLNGNAQVKDKDGNLYNVNVATDVKGNIEGAIVKVADGKITVILPDGTVIDYSDRTTVTVTDKDNQPVSAMPVNVKDNKGGNKTANTDENGKAIVPPLSENYTDADGKAIVDGYTVIVEDTKAKIEKAFVEIKDGKINVKLPDSSELTTANQTTVTVSDKDAQPVKDMSVTVTDKNAKTATQSTNANGKITVPVKTSNGGGGGGASSGGGSGYVKPSYTVKVVDKDGKTVNVNKTVKDDKITLTLPNGTVLDGKNYYTITVTDNNGKAAADKNVTLKDNKDNSVNGTTDKNGQLIMPLSEHKAYIVGYPDGKFMPDGDMSRAEAAAIFARLIAEEKGETISGKSSFTDIDKNGWYADYIGYLAKYKVIEGYNDGTFKPDVPVTRAEFVAMSVRYYSLFNEVKKGGYTVKYTDVNKKYWAYDDIAYAKNIGWLNGYADGTFKGDNNITRAEVATVTNHATLRTADKDYINKNVSTLNKFTDLKNNAHWAYYEIMEAANTHKVATCDKAETWVK